MGSSQSGPHKHGANRDGSSSPPNAASGSTTVAAGSGSGRDGGASTSAAAGASGSTTARGRPGAGDKAAEPPKDEGNKALAATLYPQDAQVDNGHLLPLSNIYPSSPQDWLHDIVQKLIIDRKLAPFYRGLDDWDEDDYDKEECNTALDNVGDEQAKKWRTSSYSDDDRMAEAAMYKKAAECPICFLYYPPLINTSRCCDQPICTECFVQIKRAEPTTSNLSSEPAACPFCVEPNFGVMYAPPPVNRRTGLGSQKAATSSNLKGMSKRDKTPQAPPLERSRSSNSTTSETDMGPAAKAHARRKSVSHTSAEVVTVDFIQADWEAKLAAVKAIAARRAARRVVFRQQGDRLVPVGITSGRDINASNSMVDDQGRVILTGPVAVVGQGGTTNSTSDAGTSRLLGGRSRRHRGSQGGDSSMDPRLVHMGPDIEELMVMEAMRLSMLDEEERRKKAEKEAKAANKKESRASTWLRKSTGGTSSPLQSTSRRGSVDQGRTSTDTPSAPIAGPSNTMTIGPSTTVSGPRIGGSTKSQFLKMPPMQRNDSSASMSMANLPPPLVPTRAGGPSASDPAPALVPAPAKLPVVQPHNFD